jgi:hypothetical protein
MAEVLLISENYIYQNTPVNTSVEAAKIYPFIRLAQDKFIEPALGTNLLSKLKTDGEAVAGNYLILRDEYVRPALCWFALQEMLPSLNFKIDNGSIAQHNSENTTAVGLSEMNALVEQAKNNSRYYDARLKDYLCNNSSLFPEYSTNSGANISPTSKLLNQFEFSGNNHGMGASESKHYRFLP